MSDEPGQVNTPEAGAQTGTPDATTTDNFEVTFNVDDAPTQTPSTEPVQTTSETPEEFAWVPESYREKYKADDQLNKFTSQDDFIKAMLEDRENNGPSIKIPGEEATDEEWNKFYDKLGRPAKPEDYALSKELPEGLELDEGLYNGFINEIHTAGLSKKQADKIYTWYNAKCAEIQKNVNAKMQESYQQSIKTAVDELKKEWGTDYQKNLDSAVAMSNKFLSPATRQYLNVTKLGNNPALIKDFYNLSKQVSGAQMRGEGPSGTMSSLADLNAKMEANLRAADYTTNTALQQQNREIAQKIAEMQSRN